MLVVNTGQSIITEIVEIVGPGSGQSGRILGVGRQFKFYIILRETKYFRRSCSGLRVGSWVAWSYIGNRTVVSGFGVGLR